VKDDNGNLIPRNNDLSNDINALSRSLELPISRIELSIRGTDNSHSNAHVSGICDFRKVVMYDTLVQEHMTFDEKLEQEKKELAQIQNKDLREHKEK
jgi:hypothetical protein